MYGFKKHARELRILDCFNAMRVGRLHEFLCRMLNYASRDRVAALREIGCEA
jgi:hypothetical protein